MDRNSDTKRDSKQDTKKRVTSQQQQVGELDKQSQHKAAELRVLIMDNLWLVERVKIMEAVVAMRDDQAKRRQQLQQGLGSFNPFAGMGSTVQEIRDASPCVIAGKLLELSGFMAMQLALLQPLLQSNPHLFTESSCPSTTAPRLWNQPLPATLLPLLLDTQHAHLLPDFKTLLDAAQQMRLGMAWLYIIHPRFLLAGDVRHEALKNSGATWDTLASTIDALGQAVGENQVPVRAPPMQWRTMVTNLKLSDHQRLQMAVLWDIISSAREAEQQARLQLGQEMAELLQGSCNLSARARSAPSFGDGQAAANGRQSRRNSATLGKSDPKQGGLKYLPPYKPFQPAANANASLHPSKININYQLDQIAGQAGPSAALPQGLAAIEDVAGQGAQNGVGTGEHPVHGWAARPVPAAAGCGPGQHANGTLNSKLARLTAMATGGATWQAAAEVEGQGSGLVAQQAGRGTQRHIDWVPLELLDDWAEQSVDWASNGRAGLPPPSHPNALQGQDGLGAAGLVGSGGCLHTEAYSVLRKDAAVLQREAELIDMMQQTISKEGALLIAVNEIMYCHILTPVQCVVAMVSQYPYCPEQMAILYGAATEFQPDVMERLAAKALATIPSNNRAVAGDRVIQRCGSGLVAGPHGLSRLSNGYK